MNLKVLLISFSRFMADQQAAEPLYRYKLYRYTAIKYCT